MVWFSRQSRASLEKENKELHDLTRKGQKYIEKYIQLLDCLSKTATKTESRNLYMIPSDDGKQENTDYYFIDFNIITDQTAFGDYEIEYISYKITTQYCDHYEEVCKLNAEVKLNPDGQKKIELVTLNSSESRKGHASKLIKLLVDYAKVNGVARIWGDLELDTPIGIENLRAFYERNGFTVKTRTFAMDINADK